jgi:hypothetical protein
MSDVVLSSADTLAAIRGWLHDDHTVHRIQDLINRDAPFYSKVKRSGKEVYGRGASLPVVLKGNRNAVGARGELDDLPTPGARAGAVVSAVQDYGLIGLRYNTMRLALTEQAIKASASNAGAFTRDMEAMVEDGFKTFAHDLDRQCMSNDGVGYLCRVSAVAGSVCDVYSPGGQVCWPSAATDPDGAKFLEVGDVVAVYNGTTFRHQSSISAIDYSVTPNQVTLTTIGATAANDYFVKASKHGATGGEDDAINSEIEGLTKWVSDTGTYANINPATAGNERWKATVVDNSAAPVRVSDTVLHQLRALIERRRGASAGKRIVHWTTPAIKMDYGLSLTPDKRYMNTLELQGGYRTIGFAGDPIMDAPNCLPGHWWMLCMEDINFYNQGGIFWFERDGRMSRVKDKMGWEMTALLFGNLGTPVRNAHGVIRGLQEPYRVDQFNS